MKAVKVYGALRKRLGQCRFEFDVATPAQAIKALCVNFPGLDKWLVDSERDGVGYRVTLGKEKIAEQDITPLFMPFSEREVFSITPVVAGARRRGLEKIFVGAALLTIAIAAPGAVFAGSGFVAPGVAATATTAAVPATFGATMAAAAGNLGMGLVLLGVAQLISPQPQPGTLDEAVQLESFSFSNVVNTARQGTAVPIAYGRLFVGSAVLSSDIDTDQVRA